MFFHPLVFFMMMVFVVSVVVLYFVVQIGIISYAFDKIGVPSGDRRCDTPDLPVDAARGRCRERVGCGRAAATYCGVRMPGWGFV